MTSKEMLEELKTMLEMGPGLNFFKNHLIEPLEKELDKAERQKKVLSILKTKAVYISYLKACMEDFPDNNTKALTRYSTWNFNNKLTEEEYQILKEWLQ